MSLTPDFIEETKGRKVLVIEPFYTTPILETGLEIADRFSERNEVAYVGPDALRCVTDQSFFFVAPFLINLSRKRNATNYLSGDARAFRRQQIDEIKAKLDVPDPRTFIDLSAPGLESVQFENFDVGMGIISSLLSLTRATNIDFARHADYAMRLAADALMLYRLTGQLIETTRSDLVIFFNGRMAPVRAIRRACEVAGVQYLVSERGSSTSKYALYDRTTPHQPGGYRSWVDAWWEASDDPETIARGYLDKRRRGSATNWYSFTGSQQAGRVPPRDVRRRVTFFTSSEDELAAIGDELQADSPLCDQSRAIRAVGDACRERGDEFVVRFHPNTPASSTALVAAARETSKTVCEPASEVDTYALIDSSDIVFTHNSTVGIEAASVRKPVFFTGRNIYEACRSVHRIKTEEDVSTALTFAEPADPLDALKYANFLAVHGITYRHYAPRGFFAGDYCGRDLNGPLLSALRDAKLRLTRGGI